MMRIVSKTLVANADSLKNHAQQHGLNATQENAAQIASLLGKAMTGQTGAFSCRWYEAFGGWCYE